MAPRRACDQVKHDNVMALEDDEVTARKTRNSVACPDPNSLQVVCRTQNSFEMLLNTPALSCLGSISDVIDQAIRRAIVACHILMCS
jgi:hypothetical protein